jgi:hypothetical protein
MPPIQYRNQDNEPKRPPKVVYNRSDEVEVFPLVNLLNS